MRLKNKMHAIRIQYFDDFETKILNDNVQNKCN
jgi:hypothetical protein